MGDRSHFRRSSGLRLLLRLASVVTALFVLCLSGKASAAPGAAVPMCGDHNESIAAPPIFRATDGGTLKALPCQASQQFGVSQGAPAAPERVVVYEAPERVLGFGALRVTQSESSRLSIDNTRQERERPGFVGTPFRPPCA
jgi:hypothetical protein